MAKSSRVILFNNSLSGGAGKSILTLAEAMVEDGIKAQIIIYEDKIDYEIPSNIEVKILDKSIHNFNKRRVAKMLRDEYYKDSCNLIISNSSPSNKILTLANLEKSWHCVRSAETKNFNGLIGYLKKRWRYYKYKKLYDNKRLITVSKGLNSYIKDELKAQPKEMVTIYNAFDFDKIKKLADEKLDNIIEDEYIIHIGRYDIAHKRQDILIEAYEKSKIPHKLVLVGEGKDREVIAKIIKDKNLEDRVIMTGFQKNPYAWLKGASLFVFSSDFEGFARVLLEALYLNIPSVSTDCPTGPSEILTGELSKFLVPRGNSTLLAQKIKEALKDYPQIDETIFKKFTKQEIINKYKRIIEPSKRVY